MRFLHVAARENLASILANGLRPGSYLVLGDRTEISNYYAETVTDEGKVPVVIEIDATNLPVEHFAPDLNGIEEPLTHTLEISEEAVREAWSASHGTWRDSIEIIGTCRYMRNIPAALLDVVPEQDEPARSPPPPRAPLKIKWPKRKP